MKVGMIARLWAQMEGQGTQEGEERDPKGLTERGL